VVKELDIDGGEREVAAESPVDSRPETKVPEQLSSLEMSADEPLFRVHADTALEPDALGFDVAV
jgi:hypothetical protein